MVSVSRRAFLRATLAVVAAPAIVTFAHLMRPRPIAPKLLTGELGFYEGLRYVLYDPAHFDPDAVAFVNYYEDIAPSPSMPQGGFTIRQIAIRRGEWYAYCDDGSNMAKALNAHFNAGGLDG